MAREDKIDTLFIVHPLCDSNLWQAVNDNSIRDGQGEAYARGVVSGVAHMHTHDIVHGDLSLSNCLIDRSGLVRVADFGAAHSAHGHLVEEERTTPYCRAPERWFGAKDDAPPVDAWAVGVIVLCLFLNGTALSSIRIRAAPVQRLRVALSSRA